MGVSFDEQSSYRVKGKKRNTSLTGLILKSKIVKTESQAKVVLIIVIILAISATFFVLSLDSRGQKNSNLPMPDELLK